MKKIVGIVDAFVLPESSQCLREGSSKLSYHYISSVCLAGGVPVVLPVVETEQEAEQLLDVVDALVFTGGVDINPLYFDQQPMMQLGEISAFRDCYELMLCKKAIEREIPVLGICRGMQLINVAFGGTLLQDIATQHEGCINHRQKSCGSNATHSIDVEKGSELHKVLQVDTLNVNSFHHQAIDVVAEGLKAVAWATDDIIEAVEGREKTVMAVQWHPEMMTGKNSLMVKIFSWLVK